MPLLDARRVRFHRHNDLIHHLDCVVHAHRDNVNGQHHIAGEVHQRGNEIVRDKAPIVAQEQDAPEHISHFIVVFLEGQAIGRDSVLKVVTAPHGFRKVKVEDLFLTGTKEVMEQAQALVDVDLADGGVEPRKAVCEVCMDAVEKRPRLLNVLFLRRDRDVLLLNEVIAVRRLIRQKVFVLGAVLVLPVALIVQHEGAAERPLILFIFDKEVISLK